MQALRCKGMKDVIGWPAMMHSLRTPRDKPSVPWAIICRPATWQTQTLLVAQMYSQNPFQMHPQIIYGCETPGRSNVLSRQCIQGEWQGQSQRSSDKCGARCTRSGATAGMGGTSDSLRLAFGSGQNSSLRKGRQPS